MKRCLYLMPALGLTFVMLFLCHPAHAQYSKLIRVGNVWTRVYDSGSESAGSEGAFMLYDYNDFFAYRGTRGQTFANGWKMGSKNWVDETGTTWPVKLTGIGVGHPNETETTMPVPDSKGVTIRKYVRFEPPKITVDGFRIDDPFPTEGDEVNPGKIPGSADVMVESTINTDLGLTVRIRVMGWSQRHHDDYVLCEWELTNTGNVDLDEAIEVSGTLDSLYMIRVDGYSQGGGGVGNRMWGHYYGTLTTDSTRVPYSYPARPKGANFDNLGDVDVSTGFLRQPHYRGRAWAYADKSPTDRVDDPNQPSLTGWTHSATSFADAEPRYASAEDNAFTYDIMKNGFFYFPQISVADQAGVNVRPGHHSINSDEQGLHYPRDRYRWYLVWQGNGGGPWTIAPGETIRVVWAQVMGSISTKKGWEVGKAWKAGTATPPPGMTWSPRVDNMPPQYYEYTDLYAADEYSTEQNNWAKDCWVFTGKDSIHMNTWAAQWNVARDYDVPIPPAAPDLTVSSRPDKILVEWSSSASEGDADFAGYRVYRAVGATGYSEAGGVTVGDWQQIFDSPGKATHSYDDTGITRGFAYYYAVTAYDDGTGNIDGMIPGEALESGPYLNRTTRPAFLTRTAGTLASVRVVPNPFSVAAWDIQYPGEKDKIMFLGLPPLCTIKIYSESGDLVRVLEHTNNSGDEPWGVLTNEQSVTGSGQIIVSGIYIAYIETPSGDSKFVKFAVVR